MAAHVDTYSRRGAVFTGAFSLVLVSVSGWILYLSAPERLSCERRADGRAGCRLERRVAGLSVRQLDIGPVQGSAVEEATPPYRFGADRNTQNWNPVYWLLIHTDAGAVHTVQGEERSLYADAQRRLQEFLADPLTRDFEATFPGSPRPYPWAFGVFVLGVSLPPLWVLGWLFPALRPGPPPPRRS